MKFCEHCGAELIRRDDERSTHFRARRFCNTDCANGHKRVIPPAAPEIGARMKAFLELMGLTSLPDVPEGSSNIQGYARGAGV